MRKKNLIPQVRLYFDKEGAILSLLSSNSQGLSTDDIIEELGLCYITTKKLLNSLMKKDKIKYISVSGVKVYVKK